jgi:hypothetical protein
LDFAMSDTPRKEEDKHTEIANDLYCAIGYALTQWGTVEEALCSIYILATTFPATGATQPASGAAFWAIATFDGKLKMTDAAVAIRIAGSDDLKRKWRALFNNMGFKNKRRNDLAHGTVATYWDDEGHKPISRLRTTGTCIPLTPTRSLELTTCCQRSGSRREM